MSIKKTLGSIFEKIEVKDKWQRIFLIELFELIFSIQGRLNYCNLSRFSKFNECTFRRNFKKFFDWLSFNLHIMYLCGLDFANPVIAAIDCSYIPKAGKKTFGLDKFWSGVAGRNKKGLEISLLSLIDVKSAKAWALSVVQTPAKLSAKEGSNKEYTRIDFYIGQVISLLPKLARVLYIVADGYYAKTKVFNALCGHGKHLITKLRPDSNMRFLYKGPHPKGKRGAKKRFAGKVDWKNLDLRKWESVGPDHKYPYLHIYALVLNSKHFKRNFKVVMLVNKKTNRYVLLASTDLRLDARLIVLYYQLRFKIEFLFRDAKQFTGLNHCQARDEQSLDFHFNMSLAAVNLSQLVMNADSTINSMNSFVRKAYNTRLVNWLFLQLSSKAEFDINHPRLQTVLNFGCMQRA